MQPKESNIDAVIVFDLSVAIRKRKGVEVHISTQHSISNIEAVKLFSTWADRLVLARELTLEQIKYITEQIKEQNICGPKGKLVEIEVFIHGAMCVAVSSRCGMSLYMYNTSANCGACCTMSKSIHGLR
jgi:putative protease